MAKETGIDRLGRTTAELSSGTKKLGAQYKSLLDLGKKFNDILRDDKGQLENITKLERDQADIINAGLQKGKATNFLQRALVRLKINQLKTSLLTKDLEDAITKEILKQIDALEDTNDVQSKLNKAITHADNLFAGMGSTIKEFLTDPLSAVVAATKIVADNIDDIGKKFGAIGVKKFSAELSGAKAKLMEVGLGMEEIAAYSTTISKNWGITFESSIGMAERMGDMVIALNLTAEQAGNVTGMFMDIFGHTEKSATNLFKATEAMAELNGLPTGMIMQDVANSTEAFALFGKKGGLEILRTTVYMRKLGLEIKDASRMAESLLDFQTSIEKEIELSILMGKSLNMMHARDLAMQGKLTEAVQETVRELGGEVEWTNMLYWERKAAAEFLNTDVATMAKIISGEKERITLAGELGRMNIEFFDEDAISSLSKLIFKFQKLGFELAHTIGPVVLWVMEGLVGLTTAIENTIGMSNAFIIVLGLMAGKAVFQASAALIAMAANLGLMASEVGVATVGIGLPAAIAMGVATTGITMAAIMKAKSLKMAEGGIIPSSPGGTLTTIGEGGEAEAVIPLSKLRKIMEESVSKPIIRELEQLALKITPMSHTIVEAFDIHTGAGFKKIGNSVSDNMDRRV